MSTSVPFDPQQQQQQAVAYPTHSGHGSVGPVIGVLAVIAILGLAAGMVGRLCSGRRVMGSARYDVEGWLESRCSSCINGRVDPRPPPLPPSAAGETEWAAAADAAAAKEDRGEGTVGPTVDREMEQAVEEKGPAGSREPAVRNES